ncbi:hypothetical protein CIPAW_11G152600 [Carya illinoinensis]|uniref:Uncharacterized protein n=1 Tax=Carya illinoinensis TaxID=32201 RepID=A0A8T1NXW0_CARIL|nr:hypothetical protein CIPAW_11G152600 [Carya illinoinensis]
MGKKKKNDCAKNGLAQMDSQISSPEASDPPSFLACHDPSTERKETHFKEQTNAPPLLPLTSLFFLFLFCSMVLVSTHPSLQIHFCSIWHLSLPPSKHVLASPSAPSVLLNGGGGLALLISSSTLLP